MFVHYSDIVTDSDYKTLLEGQHVEFELLKITDRPKAQKVTVVPEQL